MLSEQIGPVHISAHFPLEVLTILTVRQKPVMS